MILLVDDEELVRKSTTRLLRSLGHEVMSATGGQQAIEIFSQFHDRIDLVLLDMIMPGLSGLQTFERLKEIDPDVRVIVTSGYSEDDDYQAVMDAGALGVLRKPYDLEELEEALSVKSQTR